MEKNRPDGWYFVRVEQLDGTHGDWVPALWRYNHWYSVAFSGVPDSNVIVGEPISNRFKAIEQQRDELLEALKEIFKVYEDDTQNSGYDAYYISKMAIDMATAEPKPDVPLTRNEDRTMSCLLLVGGTDVSAEVISTWTDEQCGLAEDWAMAIHICASDNDIEIQQIPEFIKPYYKYSVDKLSNKEGNYDPLGR